MSDLKYKLSTIHTSFLPASEMCPCQPNAVKRTMPLHSLSTFYKQSLSQWRVEAEASKRKKNWEAEFGIVAYFTFILANLCERWTIQQCSKSIQPEVNGCKGIHSACQCHSWFIFIQPRTSNQVCGWGCLKTFFSYVWLFEQKGEERTESDPRFYAIGSVLCKLWLLQPDPVCIWVLWVVCK